MVVVFCLITSEARLGHPVKFAVPSVHSSWLHHLQAVKEGRLTFEWARFEGFLLSSMHFRKKIM